MSSILANIKDLFIETYQLYSDIIGLVLTFIIAFIILSIIFRLIKRYVFKNIKSKKQLSNASAFLDIIKYIFAIFLFVSVVSYFFGSWGELGFIAGLLTVALGWALQKPITGVVAWFVIVTKRTLNIKDRVIISGITGDITNITLTHIFLDEVGGTIDGEENSGRTIMLPTSIIFEEEIINYNEKDEYILDEVGASITYESNLKNAEKIMISSVKKVMKSLWESFPKRLQKDPHIRLDFLDSGVKIVVRYNSIANKRNRISTDIRRVVHEKITSADDVEFAYPHNEVILRKDKK